MNKPIPLEDAIKLWEMKDEIEGWLMCLHAHLVEEYTEDAEGVDEIRRKIESLGKKEKE